MVSPIANPFAGLMQGAQAAQGLMGAFRAPQLQQLQLLQEQARLRQMQGLDPVSQSQIAAREAQTELARSQRASSLAKSQREQQRYQGAIFGALARYLQDKPMEDRRGVANAMSSMTGIEFTDDMLSDEQLSSAASAADVLTPRQKTLGGKEAKELGFSEGAVVQEDPEGKLTVVQEGLTPIKQLDLSLKQSGRKFDQAAKIRGEVEKFTKTFRDVEDAYGRVKASQEGDVTAASDISLIFQYMKMLDPGSVVREGEFATAQQTGSIDDRVVNVYNKLISGERLTDTQRDNFVNEANKVYKVGLEKQEKREKDYEKLGEKYGIDREEIIVRTGQPTVPVELKPVNIGEEVIPGVTRVR